MSKVFLYKENSEDRDCCAYIEDIPMRFECGHYFGRVNLQGACYSGGDFADYANIKTILTEEEYNQLIAFNETINNLGYGIKNEDERYDKGIELCKGIQSVYDKLLSDENKKLFEKVQEEEKEYMMKEYNLDEEEIEKIFNEYYLEYRDRGIISCVFADAYDCGYEEAWSYGFIDNNNEVQKKYFDFEKFGQDLADEGERYLELDDGRIVVLNY